MIILKKESIGPVPYGSVQVDDRLAEVDGLEEAGELMGCTLMSWLAKARTKMSTNAIGDPWRH